MEFYHGIWKFENHSSEFSWCSGWQKNRKCQAIIWNSVTEFQLSILPAVRVAEIFLSGECSTRNFHPSNASLEFRRAIRNLNAIFSNFPGAPDGLPTFDSFLLASRGNFPELVKPHAKCYSEACLFGILPWNPKSESHSSEFSWRSGW